MIGILVGLLLQVHMPDRPDLDNWFMQLRSKGALCCDFSEAERISDVDWDTACDKPDCHYRVRIDGQWVPVPDTAVVTDPNRYGPALAWPIRYPQTPDSKGPIVGIRCFLPGAGT